MIKESVKSASTIEDAKAAALLELGLTEDDVYNIEVLQMPQKKTFGIFGGKPAEVKVWVDVPEKKEKPVSEKNTYKKPASAPKKVEDRKKEAKKENTRKVEKEEKTEADFTAEKAQEIKDGYRVSKKGILDTYEVAYKTIKEYELWASIPFAQSSDARKLLEYALAGTISAKDEPELAEMVKNLKNATALAALKESGMDAKVGSVWYYDDLSACFAALAAGDCDAVVIDGIVSGYYM